MDVSLSSSLAGLATNLQDDHNMLAMSTAIMKKTMDQERMMGDQLVKMIDQTPRPPVANGRVDLYA